MRVILAVQKVLSDLCARCWYLHPRPTASTVYTESQGLHALSGQSRVSGQPSGLLVLL